MQDSIKYDAQGLVPVITQDAASREVLMLAYMNEEAFNKTLETGRVHYYSRSRQSLWLKGETSGHFQLVKKIMYDCDCDTLLIFVEQTGAACHTGSFSCFYRSFDENEPEPGAEVLFELSRVIEDRKKNPKEGSYTGYLFEKGLDKILKKVGEEAAEVIIAAKNRSKDELIYESSDLIYHLSVLFSQAGITWAEVFGELKNRR